MKTILVPTDFSKFSENALNLATQIARKTGAEVLLFHVVEAPTTQSFSTMGIVEFEGMEQTYHIQLIAAVKRRLDAILDTEDYKDINLKSKVVIGKPYDNISELIAEHKADLVVMGTQGSSGLDEVFIGSNTEKVVRFASCPVISVPDKVELNEIHKIVFASDLNDSDQHIVDTLKYFQNLTGATIELLWVNTIHDIENEKEFEENLKTFALENGLTNYNTSIRKNVTVEAGIMYFAEEVKADLIVMSTQGRKGIAHFFIGSLAEDIVNHSKRPVLTLARQK